MGRYAKEPVNPTKSCKVGGRAACETWRLQSTQLGQPKAAVVGICGQTELQMGCLEVTRGQPLLLAPLAVTELLSATVARTPLRVAVVLQAACKRRLMSLEASCFRQQPVKHHTAQLGV